MSPPDLTIEAHPHCVTADGWSTEVQGSGQTHVIRWSEWAHQNRHLVSYDYSCSCSAYKFGKGKHCKHIEQTKASGDHCNWMQFTDVGGPSYDDDDRCPKCGEEVRWMEWAT